MDRNDLIAWGLATFVWLGVLALFVWLAARERGSVRDSRRSSLRAWVGGRVAAGVALWVVAFGGARWVERKLEARPSPARSAHSSPAQRAAR